MGLRVAKSEIYSLFTARRLKVSTMSELSDPKQQRSRQRKQDVLTAATRIFARDGIAKAKMTDIAGAAGIAVSSIYDYFPTKEGLAYEIPIQRLSQLYAAFDEAAAGLPTMRDRLRLFLTMTVDHAREDPDWARLLYLEIWPSVLIEEARVRRSVDAFGRIIVSLLREGAARGEWPATLDPYRTATILMGSVTHMLVTWLLYKRPRDLAAATGPMVEQLMGLLG
jgi:AcrR family transcriptional regulator